LDLIKNFTFEAIGWIESCYKDKFGTPRQPGLVAQSVARLKILPQFQPQDSLQGLEGFSHAWVVWVFHQNANTRFHAKVHPPRLGGQTMGVFASRSPHRPNPIGLSLLKIQKIEAPYIYFEGVDLVDGTPILDVKPYLPEVEALSEAQSGWPAQVQTQDIVVNYLNGTEEIINEWAQKKQIDLLKELIENTLKLDPRPQVYKGFEQKGDSPYRTEHAVRFYDGDVHFKFVSPTQIEVLKVLWNLKP
jgi:tRNA-Thr(GGU) m(6)t(6)A37 methyltransferase TsaA